MSLMTPHPRKELDRFPALPRLNSGITLDSATRLSQFRHQMETTPLRPQRSKQN